MLRASICVFTLLVTAAAAHADSADTAGKWIALTPRLDVWHKGPRGWVVASEVALDSANPRQLSHALNGMPDILVTDRKGARDLVTNEKFGDHEVHIEFLIPKGSNSGVKFHGLYEIQIYDSFGKKEPTASDCGGVYPRAELEPKYRLIDKGTPPRVNAAKPAGEWQTLDAVFLAPRFDAAGKKVTCARLIKAVLNGQVIHENVELKTPTGHAWHNPESSTGPLLLQGDHGPIAFRNVRVRPMGSKPSKSP